MGSASEFEALASVPRRHRIIDRIILLALYGRRNNIALPSGYVRNPVTTSSFFFYSKPEFPFCTHVTKTK